MDLDLDDLAERAARRAEDDIDPLLKAVPDLVAEVRRLQGVERFLRLAVKAEKRKAEAPDYPDSPEQIAEQEAITAWARAGQAEAMGQLDEERP